MVANKTLEAAKNGDIDILKSVKSASDDADQHGATCLHYAARGGNVKTIEFLVKKKGFNAAGKSKVGATAAHDAAATGNLAALKWILENTECKVDDQDGTGATVLHLATRYGHTPVVTWLLDNTNCDVMKKTATGAMPLHFAVVGGKLEIVKLLVTEAPRSVNLQMNNGVTAVYLASQSGHLEILQYLVTSANGSLKINSYDAMSVTQAAAQSGHLGCVKWLVKEQKCNSNERDFDGATALHFAATRGHHEIVDWLMKEGGAKVTLDNLGGSPLHNAAEMGHKKVIEVLLQNGCNVTITDNKDLTAAELAEKCHQPQCAALIRGEVRAEAASAAPPVASSSASHIVRQRPAPLDSFHRHRGVLHRPPSVHAEVHSKKDEDRLSQLSKETGESECVFLPSQQASSSVLRKPPSPLNLRPSSPPTSPPYNGRNRGSLGSELSSTASTLSSLSASASREFEESDDGQDARASAASPPRASAASPPRVSVASARAHFENRQRFDTTRSSGSCEESGEAIPSSSRYSQLHISQRNVIVEERGRAMASPIQTSQNGGKKTVIQIRGSTVHIDDGTGSRDIKTHSKRNGIPPSQNKSGQPKLIMTMTPSETQNSEPPRTLTSNGLMNGNISPRNSTIVSAGASSSSSGSVSSKTVSSVSSSHSAQNGGSGVTNSAKFGSQNGGTNGVSSAKTSPRMMNVHPAGFSALGDIMKTSLPPRVAPKSPPTIRSEKQDNSPDISESASPADERSRSPTNVNIKPSSIIASSRQNGVTPQRGFPKHNLIAELQAGPGKSGLKVSKGPNKGTNMVFSFGGGKTGGPTAQPTQAKDVTDSKLDEEFDPKNFLDQVPETDTGGQQIPQWKRQMLAKGIAEKAQKEAVERRKIEAEEDRFRNVPSWKRALIEKKDAENKAIQDRLQATSRPVIKKAPAPLYDNEGKPITSWQAELRMKQGLVE